MHTRKSEINSGTHTQSHTMRHNYSYNRLSEREGYPCTYLGGFLLDDDSDDSNNDSERGKAYLAKHAKEEQPNATCHSCHSGSTEREGNDAVVLSKHIDRRGCCARRQEAVETCMACSKAQ